MTPDELLTLEDKLTFITRCAAGLSGLAEAPLGSSMRRLGEIAAEDLLVWRMEAGLAELTLEGREKLRAEIRQRVEARDAQKDEAMHKVWHQMWNDFHLRTKLPVKDEARERQWLLEFANANPCPDCRQSFINLMEKNPPRFNEPAFDYFAWGVDRHNDVNAETKTPQVTLEEAKVIWGD